jgi:hypothetical protein
MLRVWLVFEYGFGVYVLLVVIGNEQLYISTSLCLLPTPPQIKFSFAILCPIRDFSLGAAGGEHTSSEIVVAGEDQG